MQSYGANDSTYAILFRVNTMANTFYQNEPALVSYVVGGEYNLQEIGYAKGACAAILSAFQRNVTPSVLVMLDSPVQQELDALSSNGVKKLGLYTNKNGAILLMLKAGQLEFDMPFNANRIPLDQYTDYHAEIINDESRLLLNLMVVDSATNKICLINTFTLPLKVSKDLFVAVNYQRSLGSATHIENEINAVINQYSVKDLLKSVELLKIK